jgi:hypothetical protein
MTPQLAAWINLGISVVMLVVLVALVLIRKRS